MNNFKMQNNRAIFTKSLIEKLLPPEKGKTSCFYDAKENGLMIMLLASGIKTFYLYRKIGGKPERIKIGRFPDVSIENARNEARRLKGEMAIGINPNESKKKLRGELTFAELFKEYLERYAKKHKKTWQADEREVNRLLLPWFTKKISKITNADVRSIHEKLHKENGLYIANRTLERIKAIFNKAIEWGFEGKNPAIGIKKYKEKSRERFLQPVEIEILMKVLADYPSETIKDYIYISLLTGARKTNILEMKFENIDWNLKQWKIPETKNGESLTIPLTELAFNILSERKKKATSVWVFESNAGTKGHLVEPKRAWKTILTKAGIEDLRLHDLRRTLGSLLAGSGANSYIISKTLGHKSSKATDIYARLNLDPVREAMEKATSVIK